MLWKEGWGSGDDELEDDIFFWILNFDGWAWVVRDERGDRWR
jgi:hypothetical protein